MIKLPTNIFFIILLCLLSCVSPDRQSIKQKSIEGKIGIEEVSINHASGFSVHYAKGYKIVEIENPWQGSNEPITYLLRNSTTSKNDSLNNLGIEMIIPLGSIICNSTSHLPLLETLRLEKSVKGFAQTKYIYSEAINNLVEFGEVREIGIEAKMNVEKILEIKPDAVMAFNAGQENKQLTKLNELGVNIIMNADYLEKTLLGRAEWLKFAALFFNKEKEATAYFDQLKLRYDSLIDLVEVIDRPTVLSGTVYGSSWFLPAGKNYNAKLIGDAGGDYLWSDNPETGWLNLDVEVIYNKASNADYWIGVSDFRSLEAMKSADARYADFDAFKKGNVYAYIGRINEKGANDYFESGNINPDLILADHIKILHPELLPQYELYYYRRLE